MATANVERYTVPKLNGDNYFNWKFRIKMLLKEKEVWSVITSDPPTDATERASWNKLDDKAFSTIVQTVDEMQLTHVRDCDTAKAAWDSLQAIHEKNSAGVRVRILRTLMRQRADEGTNIEQHANKIKEMFQQLIASDKEVKMEFLMSATLLGSLPSSYDSLITALEARKEEELNATFVWAKVIEEYHRRNERTQSAGESSSALKVSTNNKKSSIVCNFCDKPGHIRKNCNKLKHKKQQAQNNGDSKKPQNENNKSHLVAGESFDNRLFAIGSALTVTSNTGWFVDSGATVHISREKNFFLELDLSHRERVSVADGNYMEAAGKGKVKLQLVNETGQRFDVIIDNVLFVPSIGVNLISVKRLTLQGLDVNFTKNVCVIRTAEGAQIGIGDNENGLYKLRAQQKVNFVENKAKKCVHEWHRVLGHRDIDSIRKLASSNSAAGLKIAKCSAKCSEMSACGTCAKGKMSRLSFPQESHSRSTEVLDLIHTDICGPMQTLTPGKKRYFLTFIDDFSRYTTVYLLSEKSQALNAFQHFYKSTALRFGTKIKRIRSDRGGEYILKEFEAFLLANGITCQRTTPYTPQQNGVAERKNRYLMEMARCLLFDAGMSNTYWGEAVMTANFLQNRLPSNSVTSTPHELWHGEKPYFSNLHRFGSKCFVKVPDEHRRKLDAKAEDGIFLGFDMESKAFRVFIPAKNTVRISRDVKFCDDISQQKPKPKTAIEITKPKPVRSIVEEVEIDMTPFTFDARNDTDDDDDDSVIDQRQAEETAEQPAVDKGNAQENVAEPDGDDNAPPATPVRRSERSNKGVPPKRYMEECGLITECGYIVHDGEPKTYNQAVSSDQKDKWMEAMKAEMSSLTDNETWDLVELPAGRNAIGCRWVFKIKQCPDGDVYKARLVAQGFSQKFGEDYDEVFAPVVRQSTLKILLSLAGRMKHQVVHFDAKTAFLNGELEEEIFMKQPPGFKQTGSEDLVCHLRRSLYGLKQSARNWNRKLHDVLTSISLIQSEHDPCLYTCKHKDNVLYVIVHVDDILAVSNQEKIIQSLESKLNSHFEIKNLGPVTSYLGVRISQRGNYYFLDQEKYITSIISDFDMQNANKADIPLSVSYLKDGKSDLLPTNTQYRKAIGCLLFVAVNTRPDISAAVTILAQKVENPNELDWKQVKQILRYLKGTASNKLKLGFTGMLDLHAYSDADWGEDRLTRKSNTGFVFFLNGGPISWACKKQTCVAQSSSESEFIALAEASNECIFLRKILEDFHFSPKGPTTINEDNQSCIAMATSEKFSMRTKHIDIKARHVKDLVDKKIVKIIYCPSNQNIADILTKPLAKPKFNEFKAKLISE